MIREKTPVLAKRLRYSQKESGTQKNTTVLKKHSGTHKNTSAQEGGHRLCPGIKRWLTFSSSTAAAEYIGVLIFL